MGLEGMMDKKTELSCKAQLQSLAASLPAAAGASGSALSLDAAVTSALPDEASAGLNLLQQVSG
jgi:hypothetical protein